MKLRFCKTPSIGWKFSILKKILLLCVCVLTLLTVTSRRIELIGYQQQEDSQEPLFTKDDKKQTVNLTQASKLKEETEDVAQIMRKRINHMEQVCEKYGLDERGNDHLHQPDPWEYILNKEHKLIWCNIFKSSSTSWMYVFNVLAGYDPKFLNKTKMVPLQMARNKYGRPSLQELEEFIDDNQTVSFLVARNPFERLVSGYRDKIQNSYPKSEHDLLRRTITAKYRNVKVPAKTFKLPKSMIPTFTEFVAYIVEDARRGISLDMHWTPVYKFCTPCQFKLNNIVLYDTQTQDTEYILKKAGIYDKIGGVMSLNPSKGVSSTQNTTSYHVAQLPRQLFYDLVQLYMIDFELFGFQLPEFDDYASYRDAMAYTHPMPTTNSNYGAPALTTPKNNLNIKRKPKRTNY